MCYDGISSNRVVKTLELVDLETILTTRIRKLIEEAHNGKRTHTPASLKALAEQASGAVRRAFEACSASDEKHLVYFVQCREFVKIGFTATSVKQRIRDLEVGSPYPLSLVATTAGGYRLEQRLHEIFSAYRGYGEWFLIKDDLRVFMKLLTGKWAESCTGCHYCGSAVTPREFERFSLLTAIN